MALEVGMRLEVLNSNNEVLFRARVEDLDGDTIKIIHSQGDDMPTVQYNTEVKMRGHLNGQTVMYHGLVCGSAASMWKIDQVTSLTTQERREYFRQNISVEALVQRVGTVEGRLKVKEAAVKCKLLDVSGGGVQLSCEKQFEWGDELRVGHAELVSNSDPFSFHCTVRRVQNIRNSNLYGCQFVDLTPGEQDRLIQAVFLLQREEARRLRGR